MTSHRHLMARFRHLADAGGQEIPWKRSEDSDDPWSTFEPGEAAFAKLPHAETQRHFNVTPRGYGRPGHHWTLHQEGHPSEVGDWAPEGSVPIRPIAEGYAPDRESGMADAERAHRETLDGWGSAFKERQQRGDPINIGEYNLNDLMRNTDLSKPMNREEHPRGTAPEPLGWDDDGYAIHDMHDTSHYRPDYDPYADRPWPNSEPRSPHDYLD